MNTKVILITGGSSGMGKVTAQKLIKKGHTVYTAARRMEKMQDLKEMGGHPLKMDITKEEDIQNVVDTIIGNHGKLDVLINNAGYAVYGAVEDTPVEEAKNQFEVNLFGLGRLTQMVLPHMRKQQSGKIINLSSMGGKIYTPLGAWYHASKHALEGWSDALRLELKPFNIDVVIIEPGLINTEFGDVLMEPMMRRSGEGAYSDLAHKVKAATLESYKEKNSSPPSVVADKIAKIVDKDNPKTRYAVGKMAKPLMFVRKYLGDWVYDKAVMSQV
jgi:short-subunit dehydrogenase